LTQASTFCYPRSSFKAEGFSPHAANNFARRRAHSAALSLYCCLITRPSIAHSYFISQCSTKLRLCSSAPSYADANFTSALPTELASASTACTDPWRMCRPLLPAPRRALAAASVNSSCFDGEHSSAHPSAAVTTGGALLLFAAGAFTGFC
jgi:hypothetical protein